MLTKFWGCSWFWPFWCRLDFSQEIKRYGSNLGGCRGISIVSTRICTRCYEWCACLTISHICSNIYACIHACILICIQIKTYPNILMPSLNPFMFKTLQTWVQVTNSNVVWLPTWLLHAMRDDCSAVNAHNTIYPTKVLLYCTKCLRDFILGWWVCDFKWLTEFGWCCVCVCVCVCLYIYIYMNTYIFLVTYLLTYTL